MNRAVCLLAAFLSATALYGQVPSAPSRDSAPHNILRRFEVGGQLSDLHFNFGCGGCPAPEVALGTTTALNLNPFLAVEAKFNITPQGVTSVSPLWGGRGSEFLAGVRGSVRGRTWGLFAETEPGFVSWSDVATWIQLTSPTTPVLVVQSGRRNFFAMELGGGVEYSAGSRLFVRFDLGDLLERNDLSQTATFAGVTYQNCKGSCQFWQNQPQSTLGAYWNLGRPLEWEPPYIHQKPSHPFVDKTNFTLFTLSVLGQLADAVTTQRFHAHGEVEADPLYRPFVDQGWPGQIAVGVIDTGAQISMMYALHRMNHHRVERVVPIFRAAIGGIAAYRNDRRE